MLPAIKHRNIPHVRCGLPQVTLATCSCLCSAKQQTQGDKSPQSNFVRVDHNGLCTWKPLFEQSVSHCSIDVTWYPFDDQRCNLSFESWKYNSRMLNITTIHQPIYYDYNPNEEWDLLGQLCSFLFFTLLRERESLFST